MKVYDAEILNQSLAELENRDNECWTPAEFRDYLFENQKVIEAEPVRYGHWDITYETCGIFETTRTYYYGVCSECGRRVQIDCIPWGYKQSNMESAIKMVNKRFPYCNCGCKMIKEENK